MEWLIRTSRPSDLAAVEKLLRASALPLDGVGDHFGTFVVAEACAQLLGSAGLEIHDGSGLLRSVVVHESARGTGIGSRLTRHVLDHACERNIVDVYLLTTSAEGFFAKHGFERIDRAQVPPSIRASVEFASACPASATAMRLRAGK